MTKKNGKKRKEPKRTIALMWTFFGCVLSCPRKLSVHWILPKTNQKKIPKWHRERFLFTHPQFFSFSFSLSLRPWYICCYFIIIVVVGLSLIMVTCFNWCKDVMALHILGEIFGKPTFYNDFHCNASIPFFPLFFFFISNENIVNCLLVRHSMVHINIYISSLIWSVKQAIFTSPINYYSASTILTGGGEFLH